MPIIVSAPVSTLTHHPKNPRRGNPAVIAESLREHGQVTPLLVQRSTSYVLGGNHTLMAARDILDWTHVDVIYLDVEDAQAERILVALNAAYEAGQGWDDAVLHQMLADFGDLTGTCLTYDDVDSLESRLGLSLLTGEAGTLNPYAVSDDEIAAEAARWRDAVPRQAPDGSGAVRTVELRYSQVDYEEFRRLIIDLLRRNGGALKNECDAVMYALRKAVRD